MMNAPQYQYRTTVVDQEDKGQVRRLSPLYSCCSSSPSYKNDQRMVKNDEKEHQQQQRPSKRQRTMNSKISCSSPSVSKPNADTADVKSSSPSLYKSTLSSKSQKQQRVKFTLFLKILLTRLEKENDMELLERARGIVAHCNWMNKIGDPNYSDMISSLEVPLRGLVGEIHWIRSHTYMKYYVSNVLQKKKENMMMKSN